MNKEVTTRIWIGALSIMGLVIVFLFQGTDLAGLIGISGSTAKFIFNRSVRFLVNDALAIVLIYALFKERKYILFSISVQLFGMTFILIPYFIIKFNYTHYNGPLISFLHRLVLNPTLILILIPAFYYQRRAGIRSKNLK